MSGFLFIHSFRSGLCFYYCATNCDVDFETIHQTIQGFESDIGKHILFPEVIRAVIAT